MEIFSSNADIIELPKNSNDNGYWWRRHPLVFLVEAADDICYNILDIEDAFISGDLPFKTVAECLIPLAGKSNRDMSNKTDQEIVAYTRARGIGSAIESCVEAFQTNYQAIMSGEFSNSLIEASSKKEEFMNMKEISKNRVFTASRKTELEVSG